MLIPAPRSRPGARSLRGARWRGWGVFPSSPVSHSLADPATLVTVGCVSDSCRLSSQTCSPHGHVTVGLPRDAHQRLRRAGGQSVRTRGRQVHRSRIAPCAQSRATWRPGRPPSCARPHATLLARVRARRDSVADRVRPRPAHCGLCLRAPGSSFSRSHGCVSQGLGARPGTAGS